MGKSRVSSLRCGLHPLLYSLYMTLSGWLASSAAETCIWVLLVLGRQQTCCLSLLIPPCCFPTMAITSLYDLVWRLDLYLPF